jgi:hypothetical protein
MRRLDTRHREPVASEGGHGEGDAGAEVQDGHGADDQRQMAARAET